MRYVEAPEIYNSSDGELSLFLGGGITGCAPWRAKVIDVLKETDLVLLNPERKDFDVSDKLMSSDQIRWEFDHLRKSSGILFWFCAETLCPITLYELGAWSMTSIPLFVGCHPNYKRFFDISIQTALVRPELWIVSSLELLITQVLNWARVSSQ